MKKALLLLAVMCFALGAGEWELSLETNTMFALNNYSDNWEGGEAGGINWTANVNGMAQRQLAEWVNSKSVLKLSFGQTHVQQAGTGDWLRPTKATDLIDFETIFRFTLGTFVDPYTAGRVESQFYDARNPANKRYFNPMKFTESAGVARVILKEEKREWTARLGMGFRQHIDRDRIVTLEPEVKETHTTNDGGVEFVTELRTPFAGDRISYNTRFSSFLAVFNSDSDDLPNDYWKAPDINWEHTFTANITEYLMVNLYIQMLYDKEISLKGRHKETLSLGLTYKFM